jgi:hypothetical protein
VAIEYLVRMRERARWQPKPIPDERPPAEEKPSSEA